MVFSIHKSPVRIILLYSIISSWKIEINFIHFNKTQILICNIVLYFQIIQSHWKESSFTSSFLD